MTRAQFRIALAAGTLIAVSCLDGGGITNPEKTGPVEAGKPAFLISDAAHGGAVPGFYFLPPMVDNPVVTGDIVEGLSPIVQICRWADNRCAATVVSLSAAMAQGSSQYQTNWDTHGPNVDPGNIYRISVGIGQLLLGFADVYVVENGQYLKSVNTQEYIGLVDGRTLPIKFRVESSRPIANDDLYDVLRASTSDIAAPVVLTNDFPGVPQGVVTSFGGGSLGGAVTDNASGASVAFAGGTLTIAADGRVRLSQPTQTGLFEIGYRLRNTIGDANAKVTFRVVAPPATVADEYSVVVGDNLTVDAPGLFANDDRGFPIADMLSFGGGILGGGAEDHTVGTSVSLAGGTLTISANGGIGLTGATVAGDYTFAYRAANGIGASIANVTIHVKARPTIAVSRATLDLIALEGAASNSQIVDVTNGGGGAIGDLSVQGIAYDDGQVQGWLEATLGASTVPTSLTLRSPQAPAMAGTYGATVRLASSVAANSPSVVRVNLTVSPGPAIGVSNDQVIFEAHQFADPPPQQTITFSNVGGGVLGSVTRNIAYVSGDRIGWLITTLSGNTLTLRLFPTRTFAQGTYVASVTLSAPGADPATISVTLHVGPQLPADLHIPLPTNFFVIPDKVVSGSSVTLSGWSVENRGEGPAAATVTGVYLSTDNVITNADRKLAEVSVVALDPGRREAMGSSFSVAIPSDVAAGSYFIGILADANNSVMESDETNNSRSDALTVLESSDIVIAGGISVSPTSIGSGGKVTLSQYTIKNQGLGATP